MFSILERSGEQTLIPPVKFTFKLGKQQKLVKKIFYG